MSSSDRRLDCNGGDRSDTKKGKIGVHRQKLYVDTYGSMLTLAIIQLIGNVHGFVEY